MKNFLFFLAFLLLLPANLYANGPFKEFGVVPPKVVVEAPVFTLEELRGTTFDLAKYRGKVVLLSFWATWCHHCRMEMPALEKLWQQYGKDGFVVVAVSADKNNREGIKEFCEKNRITFPVLFDETGDVRTMYEIFAFPSSYLIGRDGKFMGKILGERNWLSGTAHRVIEKALQ